MMPSLRYMRTTQERRMACAADLAAREREEPGPRRCRAWQTLVNAWDDFWRRPQRSWKEHRRSQYRA